MDDLISRKAAIDAINHICPVDTEYDCTLLDRVDVRCVLSDLPSAQSELSDEEKRLYKKLRSYHNGSYAKLLDKMMASVQPEIVRCKYCKCWDDDQMYCVDFMTQDENGFCSWWDKKEKL